MSITRINPPTLYKDVSATVAVNAGVSYYQGVTPQTPAGYTRIGAVVVEYQRPGSSLVTIAYIDNEKFFMTAYSDFNQGNLTFKARFVYAVAQAV